MVFEQSVIFESYNIQAGMDYTGVPTKMMTINSTVKIVFYNRGTFFGVHVISTPLDLAFYDLKVASGYVSTFFMHTLLSFLFTFSRTLSVVFVWAFWLIRWYRLSEFHWVRNVNSANQAKE